MKEKQFDTIASASQMLIAISGFIKQNPAVKTPNTKEEYEEISQNLMDILRAK